MTHDASSSGRGLERGEQASSFSMTNLEGNNMKNAMKKMRERPGGKQREIQKISQPERRRNPLFKQFRKEIEFEDFSSSSSLSSSSRSR